MEQQTSSLSSQGYLSLPSQIESCPFVRSVAGGCWTLPALSFVTNPVNNFYEKNFYLLQSGERNQLSWFGHLNTITPWHLLGNKFCVCPNGGRPRTLLRDYVYWLAWNTLVFPQRSRRGIDGPAGVACSQSAGHLELARLTAESSVVR